MFFERSKEMECSIVQHSNVGNTTKHGDITALLGSHIFSFKNLITFHHWKAGKTLPKQKNLRELFFCMPPIGSNPIFAIKYRARPLKSAVDYISQCNCILKYIHGAVYFVFFNDRHICAYTVG